MKPTSFAGKCSGSVAETSSEIIARTIMIQFLTSPFLHLSSHLSWTILGYSSGSQSSDDSLLNSWSCTCSTISLKTLCVCAHCRHVCALAHTHSTMCMAIEVRGQALSTLFFWGKISYWSQSSLFWVDQLATSLGEFTSTCPLSTGVTHLCLHWGVGDPSMNLPSVWPLLYSLGHLTSPEREIPKKELLPRGNLFNKLLHGTSRHRTQSLLRWTARVLCGHCVYIFKYTK